MEERIMTMSVGAHEGKKITVAGWVHCRRDHGKIIFIDLRDRTGIIQCVFTSANASLYAIAETMRPEWVIRLAGEVAKRGERPTGVYRGAA